MFSDARVAEPAATKPITGTLPPDELFLFLMLIPLEEPPAMEMISFFSNARR